MQDRAGRRAAVHVDGDPPLHPHRHLQHHSKRPPLDHPLLAFDNVIATYHTAGITFDSRHNMAEWNAEQVLRILAGEHPPRAINPEVWPAFVRRFEAVLGHPPRSTAD